MCRRGHRRAFWRPSSRLVCDTCLDSAGSVVCWSGYAVLLDWRQERLDNIDGGDVKAMKDDTSSQGWELEDTGDVEDRWVLEESEQQLGDEWDLEGTPEPVGQWQPVEYDKPRRGGPAWILPTVVTIALLAVLGYSAVTLVPELVDTVREQVLGTDPNTPGEGPAPSESAVVAAEPATEEAPAEEPSPTLPPTEAPTEEPPTPEPQPTLAVEERVFARVLSEYGVNARSAPSIDSEILQILDPEDTFIVLDRVDDEWLQLFVADGPLEEGQPITGFVAYASAEFLSEGRQPFAESLWLSVLEAAGITPTATPAPPATPTQEGAAPAAGDPSLPTPTSASVEAGEAVTETVSPLESEPVTITIDAVNGLNVRTAPELNSDVVSLLADGSSVPAIGRFATNEWILVDLGNGARGWVFTELVNVEGELASLPAITLSDLGPPTPTPTETPTPEPEPISTPVEPPEPYSSVLPAGVPGAVVFSASGVNARDLPDADATVVTVLPENAALPVVARTSDGQWLQVELPSGATAWIFRATIIPRGDVNSVAISDGTSAAAPAATVAPTEESVEAPTVEPTADTEPVGEEAPADATPEADAEATETAPVAATVRMTKVVVPVLSTASADGVKIVQFGLGTVVPATGRTADGAWVQVLATTGESGWVAAKSVETSVPLDSLPVIP